MGFTGEGKNLMLNALKGTNPTTPITHVGLMTKGSNITGTVAEADDNVFTKTSHGLSNGDIIILSSLSGGAGLIAGRVYYVISSTANTFKVSTISGGTEIDVTTDVTSVVINKLTEISGGSPAYARKSIAFNNSADGSMDDSTNGAVVDVPAAAVVDYISFHSASSAGVCLAVDDVTQEVFGGQGTYTVTDADLDLNGGL